jgi:hypothetical protein
MQIVFKCKYCGQITVSEDKGDLCLEVDAFEGELRFVCRQDKCKKLNRIRLLPSPGPEKSSLPQISVGHY